MQRFAALVRPGGHVLDVACGRGRHLQWLAAHGFQVTGVDRNADALAALCGQADAVAPLRGQSHALAPLRGQSHALAPLRGQTDALAPLRGPGAAGARVETVLADIETGPWPLPGRRFDAVVVTNYLWRPLWPTLLAALADGGVLICETFADGQQHIGRPRRPEFLLQRGELLRVCNGLQVVAYEDCEDTAPRRCVQRIAAVRVPARNAAAVSASDA